MLTYRALHGSTPRYLASSFACVADMSHRRRLRSASTERLDVPTCRRSTVGGRAFPVAGAKVWNGLPSDVTSASSMAVFKNRLKTYLFRCCYETVWLWMKLSFPSNFIPSNTVVLATVWTIYSTLKRQLMMMMMTIISKNDPDFNPYPLLYWYH